MPNLAEETLAAYKAAQKRALQDYVDGLAKTNCSSQDNINIAAAISDGQAAIDGATSESDVDAALENAKNAIKAIVDAADAKAALDGEIAAARDSLATSCTGLVEADYTTAGWTAITNVCGPDGNGLSGSVYDAIGQATATNKADDILAGYNVDTVIAGAEKKPTAPVIDVIGSSEVLDQATALITAAAQGQTGLTGISDTNARDIKQAVEDGFTLDVKLKIDDMSGAILDADKQKFANALKDNQAIATYLDVHVIVYKSKPDFSATAIAAINEFDDDVTWTYDIPAAYQESTDSARVRVFSMLHEHGGTVSDADSSFADAKASTTTKLFSYYALVYEDRLKSNTDDNAPVVAPTIGQSSGDGHLSTPSGDNVPNHAKAEDAERKTCAAWTPVGQTELFQISRQGSKATLYFTPVRDYTSGYHVTFGHEAGDERYGGISLHVDGERNNGVLAIEIGNLDLNQAYSFKVAPVNDCAVGSWSNWLTIPAQGNNKVNSYLHQ